MNNQRWPADKNIQFITEYQRHECLWDPKHPQYKNRPVRESAYKEIMHVMEMDTVKDVIGKIRSLRNTFNNEMLKAKKYDALAASPEEFYHSKIPWLPYMDFLKNIEFNTRERSYKTENVEVSLFSLYLLVFIFLFHCKIVFWYLLN